MLSPHDKRQIKIFVAEREQLEKRGKEIVAMLNDSYTSELERELNKLRKRYKEINKELREIRDKSF